MDTTIAVGLGGLVVLFILLMFFIHKSGIVKDPAVSTPAQLAKKTAGWQVRFAGEWHGCSPPRGENSPGWVTVQLTDRRTHNRVIVRPADEIRRT